MKNRLMTEETAIAGAGGGRRRSFQKALRGSSFLTSGLLLVSFAALTPVHAASCVDDGPNTTTCGDGSSGTTLVYVGDNPGYAGGDFTLLLQNFDVTAPAAGNTGISFFGVTGGSGTIILRGDSDIVSGNTGISSALTNGANNSVNVGDTSSVTGGAAGIAATTAGPAGGNVSVSTGENTTVTGNSGAGISAAALTTGNVGVHALGVVTGTGAGISAAAANGLVNVTTAGTVTGITGPGIRALTSISGNIDVIAMGPVTGGTIGIDANAASGAVTVTTGVGDIIGSGGNGIDATASGNVTVSTGGGVFGTANGINAASSAGGNVDVTTRVGFGLVDVIGGGGAGINASATAAGTITITNSTFVLGSVAGIVASSVTGAIQINNTGTIQNAFLGDADLAIRTTGGATRIVNDGEIFGRVETGAGADVLNNSGFGGGVGGWATEGDSNFGAGIDVVNNNSVIQAANEFANAETTRFLGLEVLNNIGVIDLRDQSVGDMLFDRLETSGNYAGLAGARLEVDAFLGAAGSLSDVMAVGGSTSGTTFIVVNNTNAGPGAFNPTGILVVDVGGGSAADDFALAGGPIDTGLFFYDLLFDEAAGEHRLFGLPDREAFETLAVVSGSQEIWRETADAWSTRQENLRDMLASSRIVTGVADPAVPEREAPGNTPWVSMLGAWAERDDDASFALLNGNFNFDMSYKQQIYGFVGGADFRTGIGEDGSLLFGLLGGYVDSKLDFDEGSTSIDSKGGTLGAYASLLGGGFFADILVKADLLKVDYTAGGLGADDNDNTDATSIGARGDFGYRFGDTLFVEPMISLDAISTRIDDFSIGGADVDAGTNESFRGGAGLRVGYGSETIRASATARVWDVFATDNEVDILSAGPALGLSDSDLEGVYGDVSGQVDIDLSSSTTLYLKGGVLFSDDVTKPNASGGFAFYW